MADRRGLRADDVVQRTLRARLSDTPAQTAAREARALTYPRRGTMRAVPEAARYTQAVRRFTEAPYRQTGPAGFAADMLIGGTARYADKLARREQMGLMDYVTPALEVPGAAAGVATRAVERGLRGMHGAFSPRARARARALETVPNPSRRRAVKTIGGVSAAGLGAVAAGRVGRKVGRELEEAAARKTVAKAAPDLRPKSYGEANELFEELDRIEINTMDEAFKREYGRGYYEHLDEAERFGADVGEFDPEFLRAEKIAKEETKQAERRLLKERGFNSTEEFESHRQKLADKFAREQGFKNYDDYLEDMF